MEVAVRFSIAIVAMAVLSTCGAAPPARAWENFEAWAVAHHQMVARWKRMEPRCGWTVGGYSCARTRYETRYRPRCTVCVW
jgi:hypothetical protein